MSAVYNIFSELYVFVHIDEIRAVKLEKESFTNQTEELLHPQNKAEQHSP